MNALIAFKLAHTVVWAFFVGCIVAIPYFTARAQFVLAALFAAIVAIEVAVLVLNRMRCPMTPVAARYTADRRPNFDIYLPEWLARYNKEIFGSLYAAALVFLVVSWVRAT